MAAALRYFCGVVGVDELELAPEDGCAWLDEPEVEPLVDGCEELELEDELESLGCCVEAPAPAEPLMLEEPEPEGWALELDGAVVDDEDEEPPLALSFFWMSIEVDEELEPAPEGAAVEPEGAVVLDELDDAGARSRLLSPQPARTAAPNVIETATAMVESFMWPPWLGYRKEAARIGPRLLRLYPCRLVFHRGRRVRALRPGLVAALLEVAMLVGVLRIDLALHGIRAFALLRLARRAGVGRGG